MNEIVKMSPTQALKLENMGSRALLKGNRGKLKRILDLEAKNTARVANKKRTTVFKMDANFNKDAAAKAFDLIMKMDRDEAEMFITAVVNDVYQDTLDKNQAVLQRHLDEVIAKRTKRMKVAIAKAYRRNGVSQELIDAADAVTAIEKAQRNPYEYGYEFDPHEHPRGASGRFETRIHINRAHRPAKNEKALQELGIPKPTDSNKKDLKLSRTQLSRYQQEYQQIASFLTAAAQSGIDPSEDQIRLRIQNIRTNEVYTMPNKGGKPDVGSWDPKIEQVIGVEARPRTLQAGGGAFNLVSSMTDNQVRAANIGAGINAIDANDGKNLTDFANDWYESDSESSNSNLYSRVHGGGRLLGQIAPVGSKTQMAGAFAEFVGDHGPEAERVFGPPTRKAMYRYRGTERKVDESVKGKADRAANLQTDFDVKQGARRQEYMRYLRGRLPQGKLSSLQLASGVTPPSEGILFDKTGEPVVQAIGYGDDHYLPFNLKNLKKLRGGEYVRTRATGGLTSEDIYTGLISGATAVSVISRSGIFRIEFEEDFKGGRRYNQKASRMVGRYQRLLDSVRSRQVDRSPFDAARRAEIEEEVRAEFGDLPHDEIRTLVNDKVSELKQNISLTPTEERHLKAQQEQIASGNRDKGTDWIRREQGLMRNRALDAKSYTYRLNGQGYEAAMDALREQFPYYIKSAKWEPKFDEESFEPGSDKGYVRPGRLRPVAARANFFGATTSSASNTFVSAENVDYQTGKKVTRKEHAQSLPEPKEDETPGETTSTPSSSKAKEVKDRVAANKKEREFYTKAWEIREELNEHVKADADYQKMDRTKFEEWLKDGDNRDEFFSDLRLASSPMKDAKVKNWDARVAALKSTGGKYGGVEWDPSLRYQIPDTPYVFTDLKDKNPAQLEAGLKKLDQAQTFIGGPNGLNKSVSEFNDAEFRQELDTAKEHRYPVQQAVDYNEGSDADKLKVRLGIIRDAGITAHPQAKNAVVQGDMTIFDKYVDQIHRARYMRAHSNEGVEGVVLPKEEPDDLNKALSVDDLLDQLKELGELLNQ